ncbi:ankyrin repeat domain-containing protein [Ruegeria sp. HKCCA5929]|uniref:ankyrin repeat domain-containing protein n=1 Tax=Ruegeria sp. HKCCA5929 TaxID=2682988 RepID=UPI001487D359|nr:ankyrin repeat domain-containing protein [Ruegeria sp. HKCCA5929]
MSNVASPIPQPSEIVAFLIRAMSHIDDANEPALKKELQRLRKGKPLSPEAANDMLQRRLAEFHSANGNDVWGATDFLDALQDYAVLCRSLDCAALPVAAVRGVFDRVAYGFFQEILQIVLAATGLSPDDILGKPCRATTLLWQWRAKDRGLARLATEIESKPGLRRGQENWEISIKRWARGERDPQIHTVLSLMKHWDRKFARALLVVRMYQKYCELSLVDPSNHISGYELRFDANSIQKAIVDLSGSPKYLKTSGLTVRQQHEVNEIVRLTDPRRSKAGGDAARADFLFTALEDSLKGQPRLAGLQFYRGRYYSQLGRYSDALNAFEDAAQWFEFRSAVQMKCCLHYILNIAQKLQKKRVFTKWEGWCDGLELNVDVPDADLACARDFPNMYPEAAEADCDGPYRKYILVMSEWKARKPDMRNVDRIVKGYGQTPAPQLALFAHLGQVEKVVQLLSAGANPNVLDKNSGAALLMALQGGDDACIRALLPQTSLDVINTTTRSGKSALSEAICMGCPDYVQALLEKGADVEIQGPDHQTTLFIAVCHFADAESGLRRGGLRADMPAVLRKTNSPFFDVEAHAQEVNHYSHDELAILPDLAEYYLKGDTPEMRRIVQLLLDAGADVNAPTEAYGLTPFLYAAEIGNSWLLKTLVDHGADVRSQDERGGTAFTRLHFFGHTRLAADLLRWVLPDDRIWLREKAFR